MLDCVVPGGGAGAVRFFNEFMLAVDVDFRAPVTCGNSLCIFRLFRAARTFWLQAEIGLEPPPPLPVLLTPATPKLLPLPTYWLTFVCCLGDVPADCV